MHAVADGLAAQGPKAGVLRGNGMRMKRPGVTQCLVRVNMLLSVLKDVREGRCSKRRREMTPREHILEMVLKLGSDAKHSAFAKPVDAERDGVPEYPERVDRPLDLGTIHQRYADMADVGYLKDLSTADLIIAFYADLNQVLTNALEFWLPGHHIVTRAHSLEKNYDEEMQDFLELTSTEEFARVLRKRAGGTPVLQYIKSQAKSHQEKALRSDRLEGRVAMTQNQVQQLGDSLPYYTENSDAVQQEVSDMVFADERFQQQQQQGEDEEYAVGELLLSLTPATQWRMWYKQDDWRNLARESEQAAPAPAPPAAADTAATTADTTAPRDAEVAQQVQHAGATQDDEPPGIEIAHVEAHPAAPAGGSQWEEAVLQNPFSAGAEEEEDDDADFNAIRMATMQQQPQPSPQDHPAAMPGTPTHAPERADKTRLLEQRRRHIMQEVDIDPETLAADGTDQALNNWENECGMVDWRIDRLQGYPGVEQSMTPAHPGAITMPSPQVGVLPGVTPCHPGGGVGGGVAGLGGAAAPGVQQQQAGAAPGGGGSAADIAASPAFGDQLGGGGGSAMFLSPGLAPSVTPAYPGDLALLPSPRMPQI